MFLAPGPGGHGGKLEAVGARALSAKDADPLGDNIIHSVTNPIARLTGAIHVYGGERRAQRVGSRNTPIVRGFGYALRRRAHGRARRWPRCAYRRIQRSPAPGTIT